MSGKPCGEAKKVGERTEEMYLFEPGPPGD